MEKSVEELINESFKAIQEADIDKAGELAKTITENDPKNPVGLELMGYVLYEMNSLEEAKFCFKKSIEIDDSRSHIPYLYLAQLTSHEESVNNFLKTIELMKNFNSQDIPEFLHPANLDISNSYVSLAEIYMTDLCDNEDAQEKCAEYVKCAIEMEETNPSAWQCDAGFKVIINKKEEAAVSIKKSLDLWLPNATKIVEENKKIDEDGEHTSTEETTEIRAKCAEILFDLEMYKEMKSVLETILFDDEDFFEANYFMALCLDKMLINGSIPEEIKSETINNIFNYADNAAGLADPQVESEAIAKMHELMEKYSGEILKSDNESDDEESDMDASDDSGEISSAEEMLN